MMKFAIELPLEECRALGQCENINRAKEILAFEATKLAHGEKAAQEAFVTAGTRFGFADPEKKVQTTSTIMQVDAQSVSADFPVAEIDPAVFDEPTGLTIPKLIVLAGLAKTNSDGRRLIQGGAVSIDGEKVTDPAQQLTREDFANGSLTLKAGKKNFRKIVLK